jgi:ketosteroid isomerase-like protein
MTTMTKAALLFAAFLVSGSEAYAADASADVAALHAVDQVWLKSYNANDAGTAANLYDEKALLMPPGAPTASGRAAIRAFLASDMAASAKEGIVFHLGSTPDGGTNGDMGWVSGTYSVTDKSGKVIDTGKYLSVSKKENGKWLYVRDTWNSDVAPAQQPATDAKKK